MKEDSPTTELVVLLLKCLKDGQPRPDVRGRLAALRKLNSPATRNQGLFALGQLGFTAWQTDPGAILVAGAFAIHPHQSARNRNFGATCREIARQSDQAPGDAAFDRHFRRLLASRTLDDLEAPLLSAVRMAKAKDATIDFRSLHWDLIRFRANPDDVLEKWARDYFTIREPDVTPAP